MRWAEAQEVLDALLFVYLFPAAAEVVVTESQPVRMRPYKTVARKGIKESGDVSLLHCRRFFVLFKL